MKRTTIVLLVIGGIVLLALAAAGGYVFARQTGLRAGKGDVFEAQAPGPGFGMMGGGFGPSMMQPGFQAPMMGVWMMQPGFQMPHGGGPGHGDFHGGNGFMHNPEIHELLVANLAEALGLTADELNERLEDGEKLADIAEAEGVSCEEFQTLFQDAHTEAIAQAVEQGLITQEQADLMLEHMELRGPCGVCDSADDSSDAEPTPLPTAEPTEQP